MDMKKFLLAITMATTAITGLAVPAQAQRYEQSDREYRRDVREANRDRREDRREYRQDRREDRRAKREAWQDYNRYDYNRRDPRYGNYDAGRYYRDGRYYQPRRLSYNDRVYRGGNGNYYCRRSDGTTGLIVGGAIGGLLGNSIARGGSKTIGTVIGAGAGALLGREVDRGGVSCR
jgi:Ni/Co efflux regulator RcnB